MNDLPNITMLSLLLIVASVVLSLAVTWINHIFLNEKPSEGYFVGFMLMLIFTLPLLNPYTGNESGAERPQNLLTVLSICYALIFYLPWSAIRSRNNWEIKTT